MDEMNLTLPPELENALTEFYTSPKPNHDFASRLETELRNHFDDTHAKPLKNRLHGKKTMGTLRLRPVFAILLTILALLLISGAVYAVGRLTGFIPGFGFTSGYVYILDAPVEEHQSGVNVRLENAVNDDTSFRVELNVHGELGDYTQAYILSEDGEKIQAGNGSSISSETGVWRMDYVFPALSDPNQPITLLLENTDGRTIRLNFALRPARADEVMPILSGGILPVIGEMRDGMALKLDGIAMSLDRTVLQVSLHFDNPNVFLAEQWNVTMKDDKGRIYPLVDITPATMDTGQTRVYQTSPMLGDENLVLDVTSFPPDGNLSAFIDVSINPGMFTFDLGDHPQVGQTWSLDQDLQVGQFTIHLVGAKLVSPKGLIFEFESISDVTGVSLWSPLASGASGGQPVQNGNFTAGMTLTKLPDESFEIQVRSVYYTISGPWQLEWQVPAPTVLDFPTMIPAPSPTPLVIPTLVSQDPLLLEVQSLAQKFDQSVIRGSAWVHVVYENTADNMPAGQTYPPPYYKDEEWYEIDADGWVLRSVTTHRDLNGNILQQAVSIGTKGINLTTGDVFENSPYRLSFDFFTHDLDSALQHNQPVNREETSCDDGSHCLLITMFEQFPQPIQNPGAPVAFYGHGLRVWINPESGLQVKHQSFWQLKDGEEQIDFTQRVLLVENVVAPPNDILNTLTSVVLP